jgi:hypothetical protein
MPRAKSLLYTLGLTTVGRAHDCRFNAKHRLEKGARRLTIKVDGDEHNYCLACARSFVMRDIGRLQELLAEIDGAEART